MIAKCSMGLSHNITYTHKIRYSTEQKDVCEKVWFLHSH